MCYISAISIVVVVVIVEINSYYYYYKLATIKMYLFTILNRWMMYHYIIFLTVCKTDVLERLSQRDIIVTLSYRRVGQLGKPHTTISQQRPILLLDEVAAHLDPSRRAALFERLDNGGGQVWLTGTEPALFEAV